MSSIVKIEVDLSGEYADILEDARALCAKVVGSPIEDISDYHLVKHGLQYYRDHLRDLDRGLQARGLYRSGDGGR